MVFTPPQPPIAALGFFEMLIVMGVLVWLAARYYKRHQGVAAAARAELQPSTD